MSNINIQDEIAEEFFRRCVFAVVDLGGRKFNIEKIQEDLPQILAEALYLFQKNGIMDQGVKRMAYEMSLERKLIDGYNSLKAEIEALKKGPTKNDPVAVYKKSLELKELSEKFDSLKKESIN